MLKLSLPKQRRARALLALLCAQRDAKEQAEARARARVVTALHAPTC